MGRSAVSIVGGRHGRCEDLRRAGDAGGLLDVHREEETGGGTALQETKGVGAVVEWTDAHAHVEVGSQRGNAVGAMAVGHKQSHIYNVTGCIGCPSAGAWRAKNTWLQDSTSSTWLWEVQLDASGYIIATVTWNMRCCGASKVHATQR